MYKGLRDLAYFAEGHTLRNTLECLHIIFVSLFFSATVLQYKQLKILNFTFLMNLVMKSKESKVLYYGQAVFSLSQFHFLHFLKCIAILHFHNNEYVTISGLTRFVTDVSDKYSIKIIRLRKKIVESVLLIFST